MSKVILSVKYSLLALLIGSIGILIMGGAGIVTAITMEDSQYFFVRVNIPENKINAESYFNTEDIQVNPSGWQRVMVKHNSESTIQSLLIHLRLLTPMILAPFFIFFLYRLFSSIHTQDAFTKKNYHRIQLMGVIILLGTIVEYLHEKYMINMVNSLVKNAFSTQYYNTLPLAYYAGYAVIALSIIGIAEVFRQGVLLKEDNDLQI